MILGGLIIPSALTLGIQRTTSQEFTCGVPGCEAPVTWRVIYEVRYSARDMMACDGHLSAVGTLAFRRQCELELELAQYTQWMESG